MGAGGWFDRGRETSDSGRCGTIDQPTQAREGERPGGAPNFKRHSHDSYGRLTCTDPEHILPTQCLEQLNLPVPCLVGEWFVVAHRGECSPVGGVKDVFFVLKRKFQKDQVT